MILKTSNPEISSHKLPSSPRRSSCRPLGDAEFVDVRLHGDDGERTRYPIQLRFLG